MSHDDAKLRATRDLLASHLPGIPQRDLDRFAQSLTVDEAYVPWADATAVPGVPQGRLIAGRHCSVQVYPGVERNFVLYVPQQYDGSHDAGLMVFQDGARYLGAEVNAAQALDRLIAAGEIPVVIALFVEPGESGPGLPIYGGTDNRSVEYDTMNGDYARFLMEELLPAATAGYRITVDASRRAIVGLSSGGACAFNVAWQMPQAFSKVLSHCGSFVDIRGAHDCARRVRREADRPLRVILQTGEHDLDITFGHWLHANRDLAGALAYRGYDYRLDVGTGGHSLRHGGAMFGEALRWLWRT